MAASDRSTADDEAVRAALARGLVIPAHPLALDAGRRLDERRQRALTRYYRAAGAGGIAVGVHTTQFSIRERGLYRPVLGIAANEARRPPPAGAPAGPGEPLVLIAGICGATRQAVAEAETARSLGFGAGLLSLAALRDAGEDDLIAHSRAVAAEIPVVGFYLQPAVGGRVLSASFWRRFAGIPEIVAVKIAPFDRYRTLDVVRAIAEAGRDDIALYTGNDDSIVMDLLTPFRFALGGGAVERRIAGGLLGHWAVWTRRAVELHRRCRRAAEGREEIGADLLAEAAAVTDSNGAVFDAANGFKGCIAGIHEVLRRSGLLEGTWCLDPAEGLGPGQADEIDRVIRAYPYLTDDDFVERHRDSWLAG